MSLAQLPSVPRLALLPAVLLALALGGCQQQRPAAGGPSAGATAAATPRPLAYDGAVRVRRVRLYASGIGYIEAAGTIQGAGATELLLKREEIDDLLKSLAVADRDGGLCAGLEFPAERPLAQELANDELDLAGGESLAEMLTQLRGTTVTVRWEAETVSGTILDIAYRRDWLPGATRDAVNADSAPRPRFVDHPFLQLLLPGGMVRQLPLEELSALHLDDDRLQRQLAEALAAISQARARERTSVLVRWQGVGTRRVELGYCQAMPVWKASYRLSLPRDPLMVTEGAPPAQPPVAAPPAPPAARLQGWAIVENESAEDWQGIQLSLVSGRPSSFIERLSQPLYVQRPTVVERHGATPVPPSDRGGLVAFGAVEKGGGQDARHAGGGRLRALKQAAPQGAMMQGADREEEALQDEQQSIDQLASGGAGAASGEIDGSAVDAEAQASALGSLLSFDLAEPVTVPRQHAAMLPIVAAAVAAAPVSIYNQQVLADHALSGAELVNTTGIALPPGPMTVYVGGAYGGDVSLATLQAGEHRLISYAIDLPLRVDATSASADTTYRITAILGGTLSLRQRELRSTVYQVAVSDQRPRQLVIEQAVAADWTPVDTPEPAETTPSLRRWRLSCPVGGLRFTVQEERIEQQSFILGEQGDDELAHLVEVCHQAGADPALQRALAGLQAERRAVAELERAIAADEQRRQQLETDEERVRGDSQAVARASAIGQRLLTKLGEEEAGIDAIDAAQQLRRIELIARQLALAEHTAGLVVR